ncbi:MAG: hypothetical protein Q9199_000640 [Rusavskia elegans]
MRYPRPLFALLMLLYYFTRFSSQVDIEHIVPANLPPAYEIKIICSNIAPGVCCRRPPGQQRSVCPVIFNHLTAFDIAAVWSKRRLPSPPNAAPPQDEVLITACSGSVVETGRGPGSWRWLLWDNPVYTTLPELERPTIEGASYITLPKALPPDATTANWLHMEGLLGLVWGGGKWFASSAAEAALGRMTIVPRGVRHRRDIRSSEKGQVYTQNPPRAVYPVITINGTSYTFNEKLAGDGLYTNDAGEVLNLTKIFRAPAV